MVCNRHLTLITGITIEILFIHKKYFPLHSSDDATYFSLRKFQLLYNSKIYVWLGASFNPFVKLKI